MGKCQLQMTKCKLCHGATAMGGAGACRGGELHGDGVAMSAANERDDDVDDVNGKLRMRRCLICDECKCMCGDDDDDDERCGRRVVGDDDGYVDDVDDDGANVGMSTMVQPGATGRRRTATIMG